MSELSPAARAVLEAAAVSACLAEWGPVNDPPCHPDDEGWNGCHLCVRRDLIAAALQAVADQVVPDQGDIWTRDLRGDAWIRWEERKLIRHEILAIADELESVND
jgi:hypothetical protein